MISKEEYYRKLKGLQDKWGQVENSTIQELPNEEDLEEMQELVGELRRKKTLRDQTVMKIDKAKEEKSSKKAFEFIKRMKEEKEEFKKA